MPRRDIQIRHGVATATGTLSNEGSSNRWIRTQEPRAYRILSMRGDSQTVTVTMII